MRKVRELTRRVRMSNVCSLFSSGIYQVASSDNAFRSFHTPGRCDEQIVPYIYAASLLVSHASV